MIIMVINIFKIFLLVLFLFFWFDDSFWLGVCFCYSLNIIIVYRDVMSVRGKVYSIINSVMV